MTVVFAGAGCQLEGHAEQLRVSPSICIRQIIEEATASCALPRGYFSQPDNRLNGLYLAEEGTKNTLAILTPMPQELCGLRCYAPVPFVGERPPRIDFLPNAADKRCDLLILLARSGKPPAIVKNDLLLRRVPLAGLRDRRNEISGASLADDVAGGLPFEQLPVARRVLVGRVQYGVVEELFVHEDCASLSHGKPSHYSAAAPFGTAFQIVLEGAAVVGRRGLRTH